MNFSLNTPSQILPHLKGQDHAEKLVQRFLKASQFEQERIIRKAPRLQMSPSLDKFHFPESKTDETKNLDLFSGTGSASKVVINSRGDLVDVDVEISLVKAVDKQGRFQFVIQEEDKVAFIVVCKVIPKFRGKGIFKKMVASIRDYCFEELGVNTISGNARPPRDENGKDWRRDLVTYRDNFTTNEPVKISRLHSLWLEQPFTVHGAIVGSDDAESFAILNPKHLKEFSEEDFKNWDQHCPKQNKQNSFVELMKEVAA
jgi:GNAT superfamily N-acetyltransferase